MLVDYFKRVGSRRFIIMLIGNVFLGIGVSIFKLSGWGNDPFSGMIMALSDQFGISYGDFLIMFNIPLFMIEFIFGKMFIGIGTIVNMFFVGYLATFFYNIWMNMIGSPEVTWQKLVVVCLGVIVCSFGVSLYQTPNVGVAPYDSISLILKKRFPKIPYFWLRMSNDGFCAVVCYLTGGIIGLGTLISAFGLGPIIHLFNVNFTEKLLRKTNDTKVKS
ncbi:YczE/YyaS/YitT family protein [Clostridium sp. Marseille-P299]|uniref:YczE/YyaS/YitT family protein n=1 Tax=Clostridium sp. Marseille-P299 TaxID=1805477 RepID=UPI00082C3480|nr:hypothetical protein [Clostridium sp. Marseille-P299]